MSQTMRRASIKETGEELSQADWERFDAAAAQVKAEKRRLHPVETDVALTDTGGIKLTAVPASIRSVAIS